MVHNTRADRGHGGNVGIAPGDATRLVDALAQAADTIERQGDHLNALTAQAASLLRKPGPCLSFFDLGEALRRDARDLDWRLTFLEATDGMGFAIGGFLKTRDHRLWLKSEAYLRTDEEIAEVLLSAETIDDVEQILDWLVDSGALQPEERMGGSFMVEREFRALVAAAAVVAMERGWRPTTGIEPWLAGGLLAYGQPSDALAIELSVAAISSRDRLHDAQRPNPFGLDEEAGSFGPAVRRLLADPPLAQRFIGELLDIHDRTGDTPLNMHDFANAKRPDQLADLLITAGTFGPIEERKRLVDRVVRTINADQNTSFPVLWATWAVHADLALEHDVVTTAPTADTHHLLPDSIRPHWQEAWEDRISPAALTFIFEAVTTTKDTLTMFSPEMPAPVAGQSPAGNDAGGTYTTRQLSHFESSRFHFEGAARGRHAVTQALRIASPGGEIAQDEFSITDHGIGANGKPTYTINLPGVIDLSSPVPGFDPVHQSVRDMDQVAIHSAKSANAEDNLYAQMVEQALWVNEVPLGSNLLIIGHSFGADTALDLASHQPFLARYNVTHIVAAAYDSVPQLMSVSPDVDVLVLQNEHDLAIAMESAHRLSAAGAPRIGVNTFAHEVRTFPSGYSQAGHHQDHYIDYLDEHQDDTELRRFFTSVADTGYGNAGATVAVDVTRDESLLPTS